jgi:MFS family permease
MTNEYAASVEPGLERPDLCTRILMLTGGITSSLLAMGIIAVLPQIEQALAHTANDRLLVKMLVTVGGFTMVFGAPLGGLLADRLGIRRVLTASALLYGISGTAGLYLDSLWGLLASRLLLGLSAAVVTTMAMTLINVRLDARHRNTWMGAHISVALIGTIILHPLVGWLGMHNWRWPFGLYGLGLILGLLALGIQDPPRVRSAVAGAGKKVEASVLNWLTFRFAALGLVIGICTFPAGAYLPFLIRATGHASPLTISLVMLADSIVAAIGSMLFGPARRHISARLAFVLSFGLVAVGFAITALSGNFIGVVGGLMLFGLGQGWFVPNLMTAWASRVGSRQQGGTVGLIKAAFYVGAPIGVLLVEPISRKFGPSGAIAALAMLALVAFVVFLGRLVSGRNSSAPQAQTVAV